jgi:hypothetical protein
MQKPREKSASEKTYCASSVATALSMVLIVLFWLSFGPLLAVFIQPLGNDYLSANASFLMMALGILVASKLLLQCFIKTLVTDTPAFRFTLFFRTFGAYIGVLAIFLVIDLLLHPTYYRPGPGTYSQKLIMLLPTLLITPIQTGCEEILFRVLPIRLLFKGNLPRKTSKAAAASLLTMGLFSFAHLANREFAHAQQQLYVLLFYAVFGFFVTFLSLKTGGFELALALHAANNLFIALICNYEASSLPSYSLLLSKGPIGTFSDLAKLLVSLIVVALFILKSGEFASQTS